EANMCRVPLGQARRTFPAVAVRIRYFVTEDQLGSGNHIFRYSWCFGVLAATTRRHKSARAGAPGVYLRHFLLSADYAAAAQAEKMAGHAERVEKRRQDRNQRRAARDDHEYS